MKVTTNTQPLNREIFEPILKSISDLTNDINNHSPTQAHNEDPNEDDPDEMLKNWLSSGPARVRELMTNKEFSIAKTEINDILQSLETSVIDEQVMKDIKQELEVLQAEIDQVNKESSSTNESEAKDSSDTAKDS